MKASEFTLVFVSAVMLSAGFLLGINYAEEPMPDSKPVTFAVNLPPGMAELNGPLVEMDCDRDPELTISGANINMGESDQPAFYFNDRKDDK